MDDIGGLSSAPLPLSPLSAPPPQAPAYEPKVENLVDIDFSSITPSADQQANLVQTEPRPAPDPAPVPSITPTEELVQTEPAPSLTSSITPGADELAELAAQIPPDLTPEQLANASIVIPSAEQRAELAQLPTQNQLATRTSLSNGGSGGWSPWALAAQGLADFGSGSTGGDFNQKLDVGGAAVDALSLFKRNSQVLDNVGNGLSILSAPKDVSDVVNGLQRERNGDAGGFGQVADGSTSLTATGLDVAAMLSKSASLAKAARLGGAASIGVEGGVQIVGADNRTDVALGTGKVVAAGLIASGNPIGVGVGVGLYGGILYWENHEVVNSFVADGYRALDQVPDWAVPLAPAPIGAAITVVKSTDDVVSLGKSALDNLPSVSIRRPWR